MDKTDIDGPLDFIYPEALRDLRKRLRLTQRQFAGWFGFPLATYRHWEHGSRTPRGSALVLLSLIREHPRMVLLAVRKARGRAVRLGKIEPPKGYRAPPGFGDSRRWLYGPAATGNSDIPPDRLSLSSVMPDGRAMPVIPDGRETSDRESSD